LLRRIGGGVVAALLLGLGLYYGFRVPTEPDQETGGHKDETATKPVAHAEPKWSNVEPEDAVDPDEGPDPKNGTLGYVVTAQGKPVANVRVLLIPMDAEHQASPPDCPCAEISAAMDEQDRLEREAQKPRHRAAIGSDDIEVNDAPDSLQLQGAGTDQKQDPDLPTDDHAINPDIEGEPPPEVLSALAFACNYCESNAEMLLDLAERNVGFLPAVEGHTDEYGRVVFSNLPTRKPFDVWMEAAPYAPAVLTDEMPLSGEIDPDQLSNIELQPATRLRVQVQDDSGNPISHVRIAAFHEMPFRSYKPTSVHGDVYEFSGPGIAYGSMVVLATAPGYMPVLKYLTANDEPDLPSPEGADEPQVLVLSKPHALSGRVTHEDHPVEGVAIELRNPDEGGNMIIASTKSDARGTFHFNAVPPGHYEVNAQKGALKGFAELDIDAFDEPPEVVVTLAEAGHLEGRVLSEEDGKPIAEARVELTPDDNNYDRPGYVDLSAVTDEDGHFSIEEVPPGSYTANATEENHLPVNKPVTVAEGEHAKLELRMQIGLVLHGKVVNGHNQPVADARIVDQIPGNFDDNEHWFAHTEEDGSFELHGLPHGAQVLVVTADEHPELVQSIDLPSAGEVVLKLLDGASLDGVVHGPDGPVENAQVQFIADAHSGSDAQASTDDEGHFHMGGITPGTGTLIVAAQGLAPSDPVNVHLHEGQTNHVEVTLGAGLSLAGVVVDDQGQPIGMATIEAYPLSGGPRGAGGSVSGNSNTADGTFKLSGLKAGDYRVFAYHDGLSQTTPTNVQAGASEIKLVLARGGKVSGKVVGSSGQAMHKFMVEGEEFQSVDGSFTLHDASPELTELMVEGDFLGTRVPVSIKPGEEVNVGTIVVNDGFTLKGRVLTTDGKPVPNAQVTAMPESFYEAESNDPVADDTAAAAPEPDIDGQHYATSDSQGNFTLPHMRPERYGVVASANSGTSRPTFVQGNSGTVELRLEAAAELHGRFSFADGSMVTSGVVEATVGTVTQQGRVYGGVYRVTGVPPGTVRVVGLAVTNGASELVAQMEVSLTPGQSQSVDLVAKDPSGDEGVVTVPATRTGPPPTVVSAPETPQEGGRSPDGQVWQE
jgi:protocatechuate 3,4-dioxygenase beta subunit